MIEPVHPLQRRKFERFFGLPRGPAVNQFSLVKTIDGFRQGIVITVAATADRGFDPSFGQTFAVSDRNVLGSAVEGSERGHPKTGQSEGPAQRQLRILVERDQ